MFCRCRNALQRLPRSPQRAAGLVARLSTTISNLDTDPKRRSRHSLLRIDRETGEVRARKSSGRQRTREQVIAAYEKYEARMRALEERLAAREAERAAVREQKAAERAARQAAKPPASSPRRTATAFVKDPVTGELKPKPPRMTAEERARRAAIKSAEFQAAAAAKREEARAERERVMRETLARMDEAEALAENEQALRDSAAKERARGSGAQDTAKKLQNAVKSRAEGIEQKELPPIKSLGSADQSMQGEADLGRKSAQRGSGKETDTLSDAVSNSARPDTPAGQLCDRLVAEAPWTLNTRKRGRPPAGVTDLRRVNIVGDTLCDDIISYMGDSLDRHIGCDLLDLNPGVGVWSKSLHDRLQPRKHILVEPDASVYQPFLTDLLAKPNVELVAKSGVVWTQLAEVLEEHLSDQVPRTGEALQERNDTLLVTANLAWPAATSLYGFTSLGAMISYQFITAIFNSSIFQKYGKVRMLLWLNEDDKTRFLPRVITRRRRPAFLAEMGCEWFHEIAGPDVPVDFRASRDQWLDVESAADTLARMNAYGIKMPSYREPLHHQRVLQNPDLIGQKLAGVYAPLTARSLHVELAELLSGKPSRRKSRSDAPVDTQARIKKLQARKLEIDMSHREHAAILQDHDELLAQYDSPDFPALAQGWTDKINCLKKNGLSEFNALRDNYHAFRHQPGHNKLMHWDRRALEPMRTHAKEFFPNSDTALFDIQPKALHPLLSQYGPGSTRSGDMSELLLRTWFNVLLNPPQLNMKAMWAGFGEDEMFAQCPSMLDPAVGGSPFPGDGAMRARTINEHQWLELMQVWMDWPFKPSYQELVAAKYETADIPEDDQTSRTTMGE